MDQEAAAHHLIQYRQPQITLNDTRRLIQLFQELPNEQEFNAMVRATMNLPDASNWELAAIYDKLIDTCRVPRASEYQYFQIPRSPGWLVRLSPDGQWTCSANYWHECHAGTLEQVPEYLEMQYNRQLAESTRFKCSLAGECEADIDGLTEEECQASCQAGENKELVYLALTYDPGQALDYPPSDQVAVIGRLTGLHVSPYKARTYLQLLSPPMTGSKWVQLREFPELMETPFMVEQYDDLDILLRDITARLNVQFRAANFDNLRQDLVELYRGPQGAAILADPNNDFYFQIFQVMRTPGI